MSAFLVPLYDSIGNLVALTDLDGDALERARFSPFGLGVLRVDATPPNLEQIVFRNGLIRMGFSEEVRTDGLLATIDAGGIHIEQFDPNQPELPPVDLGPIDLEPVQINQCSVELGCALGASGSTAGALSSLAGAASTRDITSSLRSSGASRWVDLTVANPPAPGSQVRLTLAAGAFEDLFQNPSTDGLVEEFTWGTGETVLLDATPPRVRAVRLLNGHLEIELNEEPELGTAQAAIDVGQPATWALSADGLTLRSDALLLAGSYTLTIQPTLADRAGLLLQQLFELSLLIPAIEPNAVFFEEPDPQEVASSSVGNLYGLHGLPRDPESGLVYARNRYYDPELGRFITADPLGYVDGPSMYQFAGYSPGNYSDPMGLCVFVACRPVSEFLGRVFFGGAHAERGEQAEIYSLTARFTREHGRPPRFGEVVTFDWENRRYLSDGEWWEMTGTGIRPRIENGFIRDRAVQKRRIRNLEHGMPSRFQAIVLHKTVTVPTARVLNSWKSSPTGTHFLISKSGTIHQTASLGQYTYHTGSLKVRCQEEGTCSPSETAAIKALGWAPRKLYKREMRLKLYPDRYPFNTEAIGIELVAAYDAVSDTFQPATSQQIDSLRLLVQMLQDGFRLNDSDIFSHVEISYRDGDEGAELPGLATAP